MNTQTKQREPLRPPVFVDSDEFSVSRCETGSVTGLPEFKILGKNAKETGWADEAETRRQIERLVREIQLTLNTHPTLSGFIACNIEEEPGFICFAQSAVVQVMIHLNKHSVVIWTEERGGDNEEVQHDLAVDIAKQVMMLVRQVLIVNKYSYVTLGTTVIE